MIYYIRLDNDGKINAISTAKTYNWLVPIETDIDLEAKKNDVILTIGSYNEITELYDCVITDIGFPFADRNIRVELTNEQITDIVLNPQTRALMEWAYHVPNQKTAQGLILWFIDFANTMLSETNTEQLLLSLGAAITRKN